MNININPIISCNDLLLYEGEMTLIPHQGESFLGIGSIELACGGAKRHLLISFTPNHSRERSDLPASKDRKFGRGTCFMKIPLSEKFFVFVTSISKEGKVIGESHLIFGQTQQKCDYFELFLLNTLIPEFDMTLFLDKYNIFTSRTKCAYDLTRVSLPNNEINLTHKITFKSTENQVLHWSQVEEVIERLLKFFSFVNCTYVSAPVIYGYNNEKLSFIEFYTPRRVVPSNRRSWATNTTIESLQNALNLFIQTNRNPFWENILNRAIEWQVLAEGEILDSEEQSLFTTQMLLELLSYVLLVEESGVLSEDGFSKLPAVDKINLLCAKIDYPIELTHIRSKEIQSFCKTRSIINVGELITLIRNKLTHPTKKNREYLDKVPPEVKNTAVMCGIQIASLSILKVIGYSGEYFDIINYEKQLVPWR